MKTTVSFRFSEETLSKLEGLAEGSTRTAVLERLIGMASGEVHPVRDARVVARPLEVQQYIDREKEEGRRLSEHQLKEPPATPHELAELAKATVKKVCTEGLKTIDTPSAAKQAVKQVQRKPDVHRQVIQKPGWKK